MSNAIRSEGGSQTASKYTRHPAGTRWAHFTGTGWVRVGSPRWRSITSQRTPNGNRYGSPGQRTTAMHPNRIITAKWNPASPQYKAGQARAQAAKGGANSMASGGDKPQPGQSQNAYKNKTPRVPGQSGGGGGKKSGGGGKLGVEAKNFGKLGKALGNPNTGTMYNQSYADDLAGMQFDPQIHDLKALIAQLPAQQAQNQADIGNWMGQVGQLNQQAGQRAGQMGQQLSQDQGNVTASILAALGGGANQAGGMLGAQGASQAGLVDALGQNAQQYSADMTPFLALQQAGMKQAQIAQGSQQSQQYQTQLADLMGQRGQAKTDAIMKILDANNALSQQRFTNKLSKVQAQSGVASLMGSLALQGAQTADTRAHTAAIQAQTGTSGNSHQPFAAYKPGEREQIIQAAVGLNTNGQRTRTRPEAMSALKGQGFDPQNPLIQDILRTYY